MSDNVSSGSEQDWYMSDGSEVWCRDGHRPKLVQEINGPIHECPVEGCRNRVKISVQVTPIRR